MEEEKLIKWLNNELSEAEKAELKKSADFEKYTSILKEVNQWQMPTIAMDQKFEELSERNSKSKIIEWYNRPTLKWAASIILIGLVTIFYFLGNNEVVYTTDIAETKEITLPDNSKIILGPESSISYKRRQWKKKRKVKQKGTAYYQVTEGSPFSVAFDNGELEVLGTSFEIASNLAFSQVICYTGKVRVSTQENAIELTKGLGVTIVDRRISTFKNNNDWSGDKTKFTSAPLKIVFESIEKRFGVTINTDQIDIDRKFTGAYAHESLKTALKMVCNPMSIDYDINGTSVTLL